MLNYSTPTINTIIIRTINIIAPNTDNYCPQTIINFDNNCRVLAPNAPIVFVFACSGSYLAARCVVSFYSFSFS